MIIFILKNKKLYPLSAFGSILIGIVLISVTVFAGPTIPGFYGSNNSPQLNIPSVNTLPVLDQVMQGAELKKTADNKLVIHQTDEKAVIHWKSFDIGSNAWTHFDQQGHTDWAALNRIYDQNPSQIYGRLTGDGRVFLINQNGILFGPGSQVNTHSLVGSALNIHDDDFENGILSFHLENLTGRTYTDSDSSLTDSCVSNHGTIETGQGGWAFLIGPQVENSGTISSPIGQVGMAAGTEVHLKYEQDEFPNSKRVARLVNVKQGAGTVENLESGQVVADMGTVGMYGRIVNQDGLIRSVTAVEKDGNIELIASEKVTLGPASNTICPVGSSTEKVHESFEFEGGDIKILSHNPDQPESFIKLPVQRIEIQGKIAAPSGTVEMLASERIYMDSGSSIDVSGSIVGNSAQDNMISAQLNSVEMADDYGQKGGLLQGEYVSFSAQEGSGIGNVAAHLTSEEKTAGEFSTKGGNVYLTCKTGDIIVKDGSVIDFSGGGIQYASETVDATKLVSGNRVYDISDAPQWIEYDQILGGFEKKYARYGMTESFNGLNYGGSNVLKELAGNYFQGDDAGWLELVAPKIVLNGDLYGSVNAGVYQTEWNPLDDGNMASRMPVGGTLVIGSIIDNDAWGSVSGNNKIVEEIVIKDTVAPLSDVIADSEIPISQPDGNTLYYADQQSVHQTFLGADTLNNAGLSTLYLNTNTRLTIDQDVSLSFASGGLMKAWARQFDINGRVLIPSGNIILTASESYTAAEELIDGKGDMNSGYVDIPGGIFLGDNCLLSVAGEQVDNTYVSIYEDRYLKQGQLNGGDIKLEDQTNANYDNRTIGLAVSDGARLDVSGGYRMAPGGILTGGNAGTIQLNAPEMILDGELSGYSLEGYKGGTLELFTQQLTIVPAGSAGNDEEPATGMTISDDRFSRSGFSDFHFKSRDDLTVVEDVLLTPSLVKLRHPESFMPISKKSTELENEPFSTQDGLYSSSQLITIPMHYLGDSSIALSANSEFKNVGSVDEVYSWINMEPGAEIQVASSGSIRFSATGIRLAGTLNAPAGSIALAADAYDSYNLIVEEPARIQAQGINLPDRTSMIDGTPVAYTPLDGGKVSLTASYGEVQVSFGAVIDVSGSEPIRQQFTDDAGGIYFRPVASNPGEIRFAFFEALDLQTGALLKANGNLPGIQGGSLSIQNNNPDRVLTVASSDIGIPETDITPLETGADVSDPEVADSVFVLELEKFLTPKAGFDSFSLSSDSSILFQGDHSLETGRKIILDSPLIQATQGSDIHLTSPWLMITNTNTETTYPQGNTLQTGDASFAVNADWVDLIGYTQFSGFGNLENGGIAFSAERDIRLSDLYYLNIGNGFTGWHGHLETPGNIDLTAGRIYPTIQNGIPSYFTVQTSGTITTRPSATTPIGPIYSAGGSVTLLADQINHEGTLAAPMGQILMAKSITTEVVDGETVTMYTPASRIFLAPGSSLSTEGQTSVYYGTFDKDGIDWFYADKTAGELQQVTPVSQAPDNRVLLIGDEVILRPGSEMNASGGGEIFSYLFLPGVEGSRNPLEQNGQYVILPDNRIQLPGESIYLEGVAGLTDGTYNLLPKEFAFMPDALVVREIGINIVRERNRFTEEGYQMASGYSVLSGTDIQSPVVKDFSIRSASDVLAEGNFTIENLICGDSGDISIKGATTIINGSIVGSALPADPSTGYAGGEGGTLSLAGKEVRIGEAADDVDIIFSHAVEEQYENILSVGSDTLSGGDLGEVRIGDAALTETITLSEGSSITSRNVTLVARDEIVLNDGSEIKAMGSGDEKGIAQLTAANRITINGSASVQATDQVCVDTNQLDLGSGRLEMDNSTLTLKSEAIYLASDGYQADNLVVNPSMWARIVGADTIELESRSDLFFQGGVDITAEQGLHLEAGRFVALDNGTVNLTAESIVLSGKEAEVTAGDVENSGTMNLHALEELTIQNGNMLMQGFSDIQLKSDGKFIFRGKGGLGTDGGNLTLAANKIETTFFKPETEDGGTDSSVGTTPRPDFAQYIPAHFRVDTGPGDIEVSSITSATITTEAASGNTPPGGQLVFQGDGIEIASVVDLPGGRLTCTSGSGGISVTGNARILAPGTDAAPGGNVTLHAGSSGNIQITENAVIDVSAGSQGDAGSVNLSAPGGNVTLNGNLIGLASGGRGGSFSLDTQQLSDLASVTTALDGFNRSIDLRSRTGDVTLDTSLTAESVCITADSGSIALSSVIFSDSPSGEAWVELNAKDDVSLAAGSRIDARGTGTDSDGGTVFLNAAEGDLKFQEGSTISVSGNGSGKDGLVIFRAKRQGSDDVRMNLAGTITGVSEIQAEAVAIYENVSIINVGIISDYDTESQTYMNAVASGNRVQDLSDGLTIQDRNGTVLTDDGKTDLFHLIPGIEIQSPVDGDLTLENEWDLSLNNLPGALTLRSAGDLTILENLIDSPTFEFDLPGDSGIDSWGIRLVAGSDLASPNLMATVGDAGNLTIEPLNCVYTESAPLWFAAGGDLIVYPGIQLPSYIYLTPLSMGTYDNDIRGLVEGDLNLYGGIIQSSTGDIQLTVQGDLVIASGGAIYGLGAVRTIGRAPGISLFPNIKEEEDLPYIYWEYRNGGDIHLDVAGNVDGGVDLGAWDNAYKTTDIIGSDNTPLDVWDSTYAWCANYDLHSATKGIATMAGGNLFIQNGGDFLSQAGSFGKGDLSVYAGGNLNGHFLISEGTGRLSSMGSMGTLANLKNQTIEMMDARVWVDAQGDIDLGTVLNPTITGVTMKKATYQGQWDMTYSYEGRTPEDTNSEIHLLAHTGDVVLSGYTDFPVAPRVEKLRRVLPPVVSIEAMGDIYVQNQFALAPSPTGNLTLSAGNSIYGFSGDTTTIYGKFTMPDVDPLLVYGYQDLSNPYLNGSGSSSIQKNLESLLFTTLYTHSPVQPLHQTDNTSVSITAGNDIQKLKLVLSKKADISAGNDILDLYYHGQNLHTDDVTRITAGNRILYSTEAFTTTDNYKEIKIGGPGMLWVSAENEIDLGATSGIQAVGNLQNPGLPTEGADVVIVTGYDFDKQESELRDFFSAVQNSGVEYSNKLAEGDPQAADEVVQVLRDTVITPFFAESDAAVDSAAGRDASEASVLNDLSADRQGNLNMVSSQISTTGRDSDIFVFTKGDLNVGRSTFNKSDDAANTGIYTANGGDINIYAFKDDNVNESRVMTFYGGDITVWSDYGDINAGRGSKTAVSATPANATKNDNDEYVVTFNPPAVGSGIRTLTFDPDGAAGPKEAPPAGDVYLFAPSGEIDAGEAGIAGSNVILGALTVVNVQNISFSQGAVGVPSASEATATVGALSGGGGLSEAGKMADANASIQAANKQFEQDAKAMEKTFMPTWLRVQFMGFDIEDGEVSEEDES